MEHYKKNSENFISLCKLDVALSSSPPRYEADCKDVKKMQQSHTEIKKKAATTFFFMIQEGFEDNDMNKNKYSLWYKAVLLQGMTNCY